MANDRDFVPERKHFLVDLCCRFYSIVNLETDGYLLQQSISTRFCRSIVAVIKPPPTTSATTLRQYNHNGPCLLVIVSFSGNYFVAFCRAFIWWFFSCSLIAVAVIFFFLFVAFAPSISLWGLSLYYCLLFCVKQSQLIMPDKRQASKWFYSACACVWLTIIKKSDDANE